MKDYWIEPEIKKINKRKIIVTGIVIILSILIISIVIAYINNSAIREWIDTNIFRKEIMQDNVTTIELKEGQNANIYAFNKYIGILDKNNFDIYGNTGNKEKTLDMQISNPLFNSANRFLAIAESNGQKIYVVTDKDISWEADVEGNIAQIHINKNGYVAVVIADTSYKSVIRMYNPKGEMMFNTYLSSTRVADVSISNDNKFLAIAEVDTSGTLIQSNLKIISIDKASSDQTHSLDHTHEGENDKLITNIQYQDKNKLVCMYTDSIHVIENEQDNVVVDNHNKKIIFQSVELSNYVVSVEEKSSGLFTADSLVSLVNTDSKNVKEYIADAVAKEIYTSGNIIALNLGTEVEFINTGGWLIKRYVAKQEITKIAVSDNIAGIIYRDKIEIVNL